MIRSYKGPSLLLFCALLSLILTTPSLGAGVQLGDTYVAKEDFLVFLLVGNSALTGRDLDKDTLIHPRCWNYLLYEDTHQFSWQPACDPVCKDLNNKGEKGGPTLPFLKSLAGQLGDEYFCGSLQISGSGYTVSERFLRGKEEYDLLVDKAISLKDKVTIAGIISMLGLVEVENGENFVTEFLDNIEKMVRQMREDLSLPELPYIHAGYPQEAGGIYAITNTDAILILDQEEHITERIPHSALVPTDNLTIFDDIYQSHYDRAGCIAWGERVVEVLRENKWLPDAVFVSSAGVRDFSQPRDAFHSIGVIVGSHPFSTADHLRRNQRFYLVNGRCGSDAGQGAVVPGTGLYMRQKHE